MLAFLTMWTFYTEREGLSPWNLCFCVKMIDRAIGIAGAAISIISWVAAILFPKINKKLAWTGFVIGLLLLGGAAVTAFLPDSLAQAPSGITAPNNQGIITQGQTGGTNIINPSLPRQPLGLYQAGQQIGRVENASMSADGKTVVLINPRIASGSVDNAGNLEFRNFIISCPELAKMINPNAGMNSVMMVGTTNCVIVGTR